MSQEYIAYKCPYCNTNHLETSAKLPFVRGFVLAVQHGHKTIVGCRSCVRTELLKETGKSALIGWFSPTALIVNPFFILYGIGRAAFVRTNLDSVRKVLSEAGVPEPAAPLNLAQVAYGLAACVIAADRKVLHQEVALASEIGQKILEDFDDAAFRRTVANHGNLPEPVELARLLREALTEDGRLLMYRYLLAIAHADDDFSVEERNLIALIGTNLGLAVNDERAAA